MAGFFSLLLIAANASAAFSVRACVDRFKHLATAEALARPGAIPGFNFPIKPKFSLEELLRNTQKLEPGHSQYILGESGQNKWAVEYRAVDGRSQPEIVSVKYEKKLPSATADDEGLPIDEVRRLRFMKSAFRKTGIDRFFEVVEPLEVTNDYAVYPYLEALDFREIARAATKKVTRRTFKDNWSVGGPVPKRSNPKVAALWDRQQAGMKAAAKAFTNMGYEVERDSEKSWTTGRPYLRALFIRTTVDGQYMGFIIRPSDMLVTTDGRFVIVDPF